MTNYGRSPWIDQFPKSRVPAFPKQRGPLKADVVVVGGGLTGCITAHAFAAAGVKKVVLVEAARIGHGSAGAASGWMADEPGISFVELEKAIGARDAKLAWQAWRRAALDCATLLRRLDIKCQLEARSTVTIAVSPDEIARLKREQQARRKAGIDAPLLTSPVVRAEAGLSGVGLRGKDSATVDPYRACLGLAAAAAARGAVLYEQSPVRKITFTRKFVDVFTAGGAIRTDRVVIATGMPTPLFKSLARHFWFRTSYFALTAAVPAKVRQQLGKRAAVLRDSGEPPHIVRWIGDDRVLVSGADGDAPPARLRGKSIVQRTGQLMYELSTMYPDISGIQPAFGWAADYARTADGLPCFGPHRNFPRHLFAFGDASHSVTGAYLASRVLLRNYFAEMDPVDEAFGFNR